MKVPGEIYVPNKINGIEPRPLRVAAGSPVRPVPGAAADAGGGTSSGQADVRLTSAARNLSAIQESLKALPAIDELRVAAVRQRLQDGSYEIDPQRIADRLLRLEDDLARVGPFDSPLK